MYDGTICMNWAVDVRHGDELTDSIASVSGSES